MKNRIPLKPLLLCLFAGMLMTPAAQETAADSSAFQHLLDSLGLSRNDLEAKVRSTLMFGGSAPVSFSGEARVKGQYHEIADPPKYLQNDKSYIQSGWEGNEGMLRIGMVARAGRNTTIWSKIGFQNTFAGDNYLNSRAGVNARATGINQGDTLPGLHDKTNDPAYIHEDMCAGFAVRTVPASFWLKMGSILWTEASPLTIWKAQPRTFAWEYLPFEIEQPIARYFEYNMAKGEKTGRAAWNKKALQGINFESINLPYNLYFNFIYGKGEAYDNGEREYVDFSNDVAYAGDAGSAVKGKGVGDSYRHVWHSRFAARDLLGGLTPALNFYALDYSEDIITNPNFKKVFGVAADNNWTTFNLKGFYKEPVVGSFDIRGPINEALTIHGDIAASVVDTTWIRVDSVVTSAGRDTLAIISHSRTPFKPAAYLRIESKYLLPVMADLAVISRGFYAPLSFAAPTEMFYPFGANLLGPGKFVSRGEASPYEQNMAGANLQVAPALPGYGHLKIIYGQHVQLEKARDVIAFPYRLNGQDLFGLFHSSYNRWGNNLIDHSLPYNYIKRLGDESFQTTGYNKPVGIEGGGLRSDYLSMFETFVPYESQEQVDSSITRMPGNTEIFRTNPYIPLHRKFTYNLELDASYDIGPYIGFPNDFFLGMYGALNGVTTSFAPLAFNDRSKDMLLWGTYLRFEPAVALTKKFYVIGLAGFENWCSQKAYATINDVPTWTPIDYRDYALGLGFDWEMLARVGLHGRFKWMQHDDIKYAANNWATPVVSTEIKMWF